MSQFPDDETGAALRRMREQGDDLGRARDIDFTVVFPNEKRATEFSNSFSKLGLKTCVEKAECVPELPWDVRVIKHMIPSHESITEFEVALEKAAAALGGRNDGWGCFEA
jgi:hypothetical protein